MARGVELDLNAVLEGVRTLLVLNLDQATVVIRRPAGNRRVIGQLAEPAPWPVAINRLW